MNDFSHLRELAKNDVNRMVDIHLIAFKGFFLTSLGANFLKTYYSSCLKDKSTISLGVFDEKRQLCGFAIGTSSSSGYHNRVLLANFLRFSISIIKVAISRPSILIRLLLNINKSNKKKEQKSYSELFSIAVLPNLRGCGFGYRLLSHYEARAKALGVKQVLLTTDSENNQDVIDFYIRNGYKIYSEFVSYPDRKMLKCIKVLS